MRSNTHTSNAVIILGMGIIFAVLLAIAHQWQRPNNGDGWRILRSAHIMAPPDYYKNQPFPRFYEFKDLGNIKPIDVVPMSSSAAVVELISFVERAATFKQFDFLWVTAFYTALYLFGVLLMLLNMRPYLAVPTLLILVNPYILAYFNSPYEESLFIALCPLLSFLFIKEAQSSGLASRAIALASASTKVQFAPAFLFGIGDWKLKNNIGYLLLSLLVVSAVVMKANKFNEPNSYNRYFNGLAYSMSDVSTWPAHDFMARRAMAGDMTVEHGVVFPADSSRIKQYWGSSFWPTGDHLDAAESKFVSEHVRKWFWQTAFANPHYYYRMLSEPIFTMVKADYRMNYIFRSDINNGWLDIHARIMQNFGVIFLLASISSAIIAIRNKNSRHIFFILFCLLYPLLVVFGDGYYEFEKHVFPVLFLGVVFSLTLAFMTLLSQNRQKIQLHKPAQYAGSHSPETPV